MADRSVLAGQLADLEGEAMNWLRLEKDALLESLAGRALKPWTNRPVRSDT